MNSPLLRFLCVWALCIPLGLKGQTTALSGVVNQYYAVSAVNLTTGTITLANATGLAPGDRVVIMVMQGASYNNTNSSSYGTLTSLNEVGSFEFATICEVNSNIITLQYLPLASYAVSSGQVIQVIKVPRVVNGEITATVQPQAWNGVTGGVVVIEAIDTLKMLAGIDASGLGFRGGNNNSAVFNCNATFTGSPNYYYVSSLGRAGFKGEGIGTIITSQETGKGPLISGGGGGNDHNTGGAGGSNYGAGGLGGTRINSVINCLGNDPGIGGKSLSSIGYSSANKLAFMGGGGGGAHQNNAQSFPGGNGGGIVIIRCHHLDGGTQSILANGITAPNSRSDGASGGGAGGAILIEASTASASSLILSSKGGDGGGSNFINVSNCLGPGGGGGGGAVWTSFTPGAGITTVLTGGSRGFSSSVNTNTCPGQDRGAVNGATGAAITGLILPEATTNPSACVLPLLPEAWLNAERTHNEVSWAVTDLEMAARVTLLRWQGQGSSQTLMDTLLYQGNHQYSLFDSNRPEGVSHYRLLVTDIDGHQMALVEVEAWFQTTDGPPVQLVSIGNNTQLVWKGSNAENVQVQVFGIDGRAVWTTKWDARQPGEVLELSGNWAAGMYFVQVGASAGNRRFSFICP